MDAFVISSLPLRVDEEIPSAGSLRSTSVTRLRSYYGPIRHPHASAPLPGVVGYRNGLPPRISPRGMEGFSSCFTCPCHRATVVYPAGVGRALQPDCARPCCLRHNSESSTSGSHPFRGHFAFTCVAARWLAHRPKSGFVDELQVLGFPPTCHPSYGALALRLC